VDCIGAEILRTLQKYEQIYMLSHFETLTESCAFAEAAGTKRDRPHASRDEQDV
jgi:hypothetical protein